MKLESSVRLLRRRPFSGKLSGLNPTVGIGTAAVPGSCGELVQGMRGGKHFHVTCPVELYSRVLAVRKAASGVSAHPHSPKAVRAVEILLERFQIEEGFELFIDRDMPVGKGMASSTSDIAASCWAVADALGIDLGPGEVAELAISVEPSDGVFYPGIVAFDHVDGGLLKELGRIELDVVVIEPPSVLDTAWVAENRPRYAEDDLLKIDEAYLMVAEGISTVSTKMVADGATLSAEINQRYLPKEHFDDIAELALRSGALGVNAAHSGTVMGILADPCSGKMVEERIRPWLPSRYSARTTKVTGGGKAEVEVEKLRKGTGMHAIIEMALYGERNANRGASSRRR